MMFGVVKLGEGRSVFSRQEGDLRFSDLALVRVRTIGRIRIHGVAQAPLPTGPPLPSRRARSTEAPAGRVDVDRPLGMGRPRVVALPQRGALLLGQLVRLPVLREQLARPPRTEGLLGQLDRVGRLAAGLGVLGVEDPLPVDLVVDRAPVVSTLEEGCLTAVALEADLQTALAVADQMGMEDRSSPEVAAAEVHPRRMTC